MLQDDCVFQADSVEEVLCFIFSRYFHQTIRMKVDSRCCSPGPLICGEQSKEDRQIMIAKQTRAMY